MINMDRLKEVAMTKQMGHIQIVDRSLTINTNTHSMTITGHKINESTFIVKRDGTGDIFIMDYKCSNDNILRGIEYLYHMYKSIKS